jgi:hypothetical protein
MMPTLEPRSKYGFPVLVDKLGRAQRIAAEVRKRKDQVCNCIRCTQDEMLEAVQRLTNSRK